MYYVHGRGIKTHFRTLKNAKKEKLSNFNNQNMSKSELEYQQKKVFVSIFWWNFFQALRPALVKSKI